MTTEPTPRPREARDSRIFTEGSTFAERARWLAEAEAAEPELFGDESPEHGGQDAEGRCDAEP